MLRANSVPKKFYTIDPYFTLFYFIKVDFDLAG